MGRQIINCPIVITSALHKVEINARKTVFPLTNDVIVSTKHYKLFTE